MTDSKKLNAEVSTLWDNSILPVLEKYIAIPNKSPMFDTDWEKHGYMDQAVELLVGWCKQQAIQGMKLQVVRLPKRTPLIFIEVAGQSERTVLLYGHLDKQPEMEGWAADLGPWKPVRKGDKLYGRGGADDGYAVFAALSAIGMLQKQGLTHSRCVIMIEASEESGSPDLPHYVEHLQAQIGTPDLVVCLDSGSGNYEQMWCTTSLRGLVVGELRVEILTEGVHSGSASGVVPSSFRIIRQLLSRIEDEKTGQVLLKELSVEIPEQRVAEAKAVAEALGDMVWSEFPFCEGAKPVAGSGAELVLARTWRPALAITGVDNVPAIKDGGNVLRPKTALKLSMRIPPTCSAEVAMSAMKKALEENPPYGAKVSFTQLSAGSGWNSPPLAGWLQKACDEASQHYFGKPILSWGEGGSIPFIGMLGKRFPQAQFVVTGVLGPHSNAHGPNEFLHIPTAKKLTCCVAEILAAEFARKN